MRRDAFVLVSSSDKFFSDDYLTRALLVSGCFAFAVLIVTLPAGLIEERTLNGINLWGKPLKFDLSILIHSFTIAILAQQLSPQRRNTIVLRSLSVLYLASIVFEIVYIHIQSMRGRHSHFNLETPFEAMMYPAMGLGALIMVILPFAIGLYLAFQKDANRSGYRVGTVLGCVLAPILTIIVAGYMSMSGSHFVNAPRLLNCPDKHCRCCRS